MCPECFEAWQAWSSYQLVPPLRINGGASYDDSFRGVQERRQHNVDEWRKTIRRQQIGIREQCARLEHETTHDRPSSGLDGTESAA
jgi:hypothetical protein